jgi:hypothetical protein
MFKTADVLYDPCFLIVSLLNQAKIVLDTGGQSKVVVRR